MSSEQQSKIVFQLKEIMGEKTRIEKDFLGKVEVPADAFWGVNTQRALENFQISGKTLPPEFIEALAQVKLGCLLVNQELNQINNGIRIHMSLEMCSQKVVCHFFFFKTISVWYINMVKIHGL